MSVPQGIILGPLLSVSYVNDLLLNMPKNCVTSYADDSPNSRCRHVGGFSRSE